MSSLAQSEVLTGREPGIQREIAVPKSAASFREALARLALQLGLPGDSLSVSLLSFARFFSLPLEGASLAALRRKVLYGAALPQGGGRKDRPAAGTDERALAAAAAFSKGFSLSEEALGEYAAAIGGFGGGGEEGSGERGSGGRREQGSGNGECGAEHIRSLAVEAEAGSPLLGLLNRVRGRDGRRWLVFPFTFPAGGDEFQVSVRVLLSPEGGGQKVERLAADIRCPRRRWLWSLERPGEPGGEVLAVLDPAFSGAEKRLEREIREILGPLADRVSIQNGLGEPLFSDCRDEALYPVNEEV